MAVGDSKDPDGPTLIFTPADWATFTAAIRATAWSAQAKMAVGMLAAAIARPRS